MRNSDDSRYDTAQICTNGHLITKFFKSQPARHQKFCDKCGKPTITECPNCKSSIRGYYDVPGVIGSFKYEVPKHCYNCGKSYPWTESKLKAAQDLVNEIDSLNPNEKETLVKSLDDLIKDSPNTQVAALRFKKFVAKAGMETANALKEILVGIVSEAVKKTIWH